MVELCRERRRPSQFLKRGTRSMPTSRCGVGRGGQGGLQHSRGPCRLGGDTIQSKMALLSNGR